MNAIYVIMEKTPFPGEWTKVATYRLQQAELKTFPVDRFYHQRATRIGSLLAYQWSDAQMLLETIRQAVPYAEFRLLGMMA